MQHDSNSKPGSIDEYIRGFPAEVQDLLTSLRSAIRLAAPDAVEKISYQMPTFHLNGNLVHFAAYKNHIGFYPGPSGITAFKEELKIYKTSKGAVQFPVDRALPLDLIKRIVVYRAQDNQRSKKEVG